MTSYTSLKTELTQMKQEAYDTVRSQTKPSVSASFDGFFSTIGSSLKFIFSEKENILFTFLQWGVIAVGYYLWVSGLKWIPPEVWEAVDANKQDDSLINLAVVLWSFACVGISAYPIGIVNSCMNASFILRSQGRQSTVLDCLKLVMHKSGRLWIFSWIDGWWTVNRILERCPSKHKPPLSVRMLREGLYQAWKLASLSFIPATLYGRNLTDATGDSVKILSDGRYFRRLMKLRLAYSLMCWIIGISTYIGGLFFMAKVYLPTHPARYDLYSFYLMIGIPILFSTLILMMFFRPLYIIAACRTYVCYAKEKGLSANLPETSPKFISAFVGFLILLTATLTGLYYLNRFGVVDLL